MISAIAELPAVDDFDNETESRVVDQICIDLQCLQRERVSHLKSKIMLGNRLKSSVAVSLGYRSGLDEDKRKESFAAAEKVIKSILDGTCDDPTAMKLMPLVTEAGRSEKGFDTYVHMIEKQMVKLAKQLPVASWVEEPGQRGFGLPSLAILVGECGNLANYANPAKVWRRMGCAPFEKNGVNHMGCTWKSNNKKGGLSASEWEEFGYCPRRRSVAFLHGENLVKLNQLGPYRVRYDAVKAKKMAEEDKAWPKLRCHRHAMLLATKLLYRELWCEWNPDLVEEQDW